MFTLSHLAVWRRVLSLSLLFALLTGCITEPAPEEPTMYGHIDKPKKLKKAKPMKTTPAPLGGGGGNTSSVSGTS